MAKGGKKKEKKEKDPNAPKRPVTAFFFYQSERRQTLKKEKPELDHKQIISVMSTEWNKLPEKDKKKYLVKAEEDKKRYEKEKAEYENSK